MTREEALKKIEEWKLIRTTKVWQDFISGIEALREVHSHVLRKSSDEKEIYRSQGAVKVADVVLNAFTNQVREATEVLDGKKRGTTGVARSL